VINLKRQYTKEIATTPEIRAHFPALERQHQGRAVAYFDGPGGTQVPRPVAEAMVDYLYHHNANTHWEYPTSAETDRALDAARQTFAEFFNASPAEIVFGANMTTLTFHLSRALGRRFSPGDEIIVTELDHHANIDPWRELAVERDLRLRVVKMIPETGQLDWEEFKGLLCDKTKLVALGAASNALGTINDIRAAARLTHEAGALIFIDAVHYAPHTLIDVRALDCDFLACSAYKFNGPHVGILFGKRDLLEAIDFPKLRPAHDTAPGKAETGTLNHEGIVGAAAAVDFLASLSSSGESRRQRLRLMFEELHARGARLTKTLWGLLSTIEGVHLYGPPPGIPRTPTISFTIKGVAPSEVARRLAEVGVFVSHGDFYASTVVECLGLSTGGLVRAGCAIYTTSEEIWRLVEGVRLICQERAASPT
jgi:cysteine desulfurase family protein (TIGR01976 family)